MPTLRPSWLFDGLDGSGDHDQRWMGGSIHRIA
jgi:hypothetical protein